MLLLCVRTNYIQSLDRVDQLLQEDSEVLFCDQVEDRKNSEYMYSDWRKIVVVFKNLLLNLVLMLFYNFSIEHMWTLLYDQFVEPM